MRAKVSKTCWDSSFASLYWNSTWLRSSEENKRQALAFKMLKTGPCFEEFLEHIGDGTDQFEGGGSFKCVMPEITKWRDENNQSLLMAAAGAGRRKIVVYLLLTRIFDLQSQKETRNHGGETFQEIGMRVFGKKIWREIHLGVCAVLREKALESIRYAGKPTTQNYTLGDDASILYYADSIKRHDLGELKSIFHFPWEPKREMNLFWKREIAGIGESSVKGAREENVLMFAIKLRRKEIVQYILDFGIFSTNDLTSKDEKGETINEMGRKTYGVLWTRWISSRGFV